MAGQIAMNPKDLWASSVKLYLAASSLNSSLDTWKDQGEKSIGLDAFAEMYVELELAIRSFESLLKNDAVSIRKISEEFIKNELETALKWIKNLGN